MKTALLFLCGLSLTHAVELPNVVIIYADDMGYGDLGANNPGSKIPTPHLDQLASEGMRFTDGHSSSGICTPSRFALLTGQYHWRRFHRIVDSFGPPVFRSGDFTLAKMFQSMGYRTAAIGKWHLGWNWKASMVPDSKGKLPKNLKAIQPADIDWTRPISGGPLDRGFDYYFGDGTINFPPYCYIENDRVVGAPTVLMDTATFAPIPEGKWEFRDGPMVDGWDPYEVLPTITDKAVEWIAQQNEDQPFFLYFSLPSPHAPIIPNTDFRGKSEAGPYGDFVYETDAMIGRVLDSLDENGFAENTLVFFSSDNGPELYAYDRAKECGHWSSGPLRGLKRDLWEGGHRVPFLIRWPGHTVPGSVSDETVSQIDLAATFADIIGYELSPKEAVDSHNLLPVLLGEPYPQPLREATVQNTYRHTYAIRKGDWLYINTHKAAPKGGEPDWFLDERGLQKREKTSRLLYNLKEDIGQQNNLYETYQEKAKEMAALLKEYLDGESSAPHAQ
ncbi:MAG: arylsulfatase [Verrucomicrobiota bacterium]